MSILGQTLNNPFNIRYNKSNKWKGQVGQVSGFVKFDTLDNGVRAGVRLFQNYINQGKDSIDLIVNRLAPASENNVSEYISFLVKKTGLPASKKLKHGDLVTLLPYVALKETSITLPSVDILKFL